MSAQVIPFAFQEHYPVRVILIEGEPWFCLVDVCAILEIKNSRQVAQNQLDEKGVCKTYTLTQGGEQEVTFINEPNLYRVIFRSNKPEAKTFQDWVFNDVLPTLRRQGRYEMPGARPEPFITLNMSQNECMAFIERCVAVAVRTATQTSPRARRVKFSELEKAEMLRLHSEGIGATEIARCLNRSAGSVGNFLLQYRRGATRKKMN
jgi:prophage antirepressor-like protein